jgi:hypothetical protein
MDKESIPHEYNYNPDFCCRTQFKTLKNLSGESVSMATKVPCCHSWQSGFCLCQLTYKSKASLD